MLSLAATTVACGTAEQKTVIAEFADVGDLVVRANVQQSDAVVGTVRSIDLVERTGEWVARVEMDLDPETQVTDATTAVVRSTSLLGEKYVDLVPGGAGQRLRGAIPTRRTAKAPELEAVFSQLGGILESGALEDLAALSSASAMILEGQEDNLGVVLDKTANLVASLSSQKDAIASALTDLSSASRTLADRSNTLDRALDVSADALSIIASQQSELDELLVQLDRIGGPLARLTKAHKGDVDAQLRDLNTIVPKLYEVRGTLEHAVEVLPRFTTLFARATPGDYVQLDVFAEALPVGTPTAAGASAGRTSPGELSALWLEPAR
jgi:phospholipid/cholesterol/gamma-HCH transport system substrate-binding protein